MGAGLWSSTGEIGEHVPVGDRFEPKRDEAWRRETHAHWRRFVERAADLR